MQWLPLSRHTAQTSLGTTRFFLSIHLPHLSCMIPCSYWALTCCAALPSCKTLYVISVRQTRDLPVSWYIPHIQLPSDSTSRWTPLPSANASYCRAHSGLSPPSCCPCRAHNRKTPGSHEPGVFVPLRGRRIPATAGFYGVRVLGLTPRRAGGRCPPRPRWSARSDRDGPSCLSGGSALPAAPSPCRGDAGR